MRKYLLLLTLTACSVSVFAQTEKEKKAYADEAAQLQKQVWDNPVLEFKATAIPGNLSNESAVVLARSFSLSRSSAGKLKFGHALTFTTRTTKFSIYHDRVRINDKTALESFSTLEYQKILNKTTSSGFAKFLDVNNTYVGAKVIKPAGKETIVNTSEEVLTKNESKDKQGKLAIPDLQVGDILDYYVCDEEIADKDQGNSYKDNDNVLFLQDEYPIIYYSIDFQFNKKINVKTIYANGAQHFDVSQNSDGDQLYTVKLHNLPKYKSQLWTSAARQYPYIEIGSSYNDALDKIIKANNFNKNPMLEAQKYDFETDYNENLLPYKELVSALENYFKSGKALRNASRDSVAKVLYNVWKYKAFCYYIGEGELGNTSDYKQHQANSRFNVVTMSIALTDQKVDHDVILVASRYSNSLDNVFNKNDFDAIIRINSGAKSFYMCFDNAGTLYNELPERFQGEQVIVLRPKRRSSTSYSFSESQNVLPVTSSEMNNVTELMNVNLADQDMQKLKVERMVSQKGALRDDQLGLLTVSDIDKNLQQAANGDDLFKRYKNYYGAKNVLQNLQTAFDKEKQDQVKYFTEEIKGKYSQDPKDVNNCKIINTGLDVSSPVFQYTETFTLNNLVKKAGNNYIIDAGKLTGGFLKLEEKNKTRDVDVYMSVPRSFSYTMIINIPQGYTVKGMEEMTQSKSNKTGSFTSSAVVNGNKLTITATRSYAHNFEKAADWPLLVDLIGTASDFDSKKILLEKKN